MNDTEYTQRRAEVMAQVEADHAQRLEGRSARRVSEILAEAARDGHNVGRILSEALARTAVELGSVAALTVNSKPGAQRSAVEALARGGMAAAESAGPAA